MRLTWMGDTPRFTCRSWLVVFTRPWIFIGQHLGFPVFLESPPPLVSLRHCWDRHAWGESWHRTDRLRFASHSFLNTRLGSLRDRIIQCIYYNYHVEIYRSNDVSLSRSTFQTFMGLSLWKSTENSSLLKIINRV